MAHEFTTSRGVAMTLRPVSQFKLDNLRSTKRVIDPPMYEMSTVAGATQSVPLDETIAINQGRLPEWQAYQEAYKKNEADYGRKFMTLLVWDGVDITPSDEWKAECEYFGTLPANPIEQKYRYVQEQCLGTPDDVSNLIAEIMLVSQMSKEAVDNLRNSFRRRMAGQKIGIMSEAEESLAGTQLDLGSVGDGPLLEPETV